MTAYPPSIAGILLKKVIGWVAGTLRSTDPDSSSSLAHSYRFPKCNHWSSCMHSARLHPRLSVCSCCPEEFWALCKQDRRGNNSACKNTKQQHHKKQKRRGMKWLWQNTRYFRHTSAPSPLARCPSHIHHSPTFTRYLSTAQGRPPLLARYLRTALG